MTECRWCKEGGKPEWSTDAQVWIHRRESLDRQCTNPPPVSAELDIAKWKEIISGWGELAYKAYFVDDRDLAWGWNQLSKETRSKWQLVGLALAEKLCPHEDKTVTSAGNVWCNKCGWQIPKEKL